MATFYYLERAELHVCNKQLACSQDSYDRLDRKGKVGESKLAILGVLARYRVLTEEMIQYLLPQKVDGLHEELDMLAEYGLVLKQFFQGKVDGEEVRTVTFYCLPEALPDIEEIRGIKRMWKWNKELTISEAMAELAFMQFHIALRNNIPKKAMQAYTHYSVRGWEISGRYRLKSRNYSLGYSHVFVEPVRDFAKDNVGVTELIGHVCDAYAFSDVKMPWFVLLCENKIQCANLSRKLKANQSTREAEVFYLLDTDYDMTENPLKVLQTYQFEGETQRVIGETYSIRDWF